MDARGRGRARFEKTVDGFFSQQPCDNAIDAKRALLVLYDFIAKEAVEAVKQQQGSLTWAEHLFKIQQIIRWTPLRIFLRTLAEDPLLAIRASAKGEICDRTGMREYFDDPEVGLIASANLQIIFGGRQPETLTTEVKEAMQLWLISSQGLKFTPDIMIRDMIRNLSPPEE